MTVRTGFYLVSVLAAALCLALPVGLARAQEPPPSDVETALRRAWVLLLKGDSRNGCKEYLRASELSHGKSVPSLIGLAGCYEKLGKADQGLDMARQARAIAATPREQAQAAAALACVLIRQPDAQAKSQAADLFKENILSQGGNWARAGYYLALRELHRDGDAAEFLRSSKEDAKKDSGGFLPCSIRDSQEDDVLDEYVHAVNPEEPLFGGKVTPPKVIHSVLFEMTDLGRHIPGLSGQVVLEATIDLKGRVQDVRAVEGMSFGITEKAIETLKQWRFQPGTLDGKPVPTDYVMTVNFKVGRPASAEPAPSH